MVAPFCCTSPFAVDDEASAVVLPSPSGTATPEVDATGVFDEPEVPGGTKDTADEFPRSALNEPEAASCEGPGLLSGVVIFVDKWMMIFPDTGILSLDFLSSCVSISMQGPFSQTVSEGVAR